MRKIIFFSLLLVFTVSALSQNKKKSKIYKIWVHTVSEPYKVKGYLYETGDDFITIINDSSEGNGNMSSIKIEEIRKIKLRKNGSVGKGAWMGGLIGMGTGIAIGYIDGDDDPGWFSYSAEEKALSWGATLTIVGAGTGVFIGTRTKKFTFDQNLDVYTSLRDEINQYTLKKNQAINNE